MGQIQLTYSLLSPSSHLHQLARARYQSVFLLRILTSIVVATFVNNSQFFRFFLRIFSYLSSIFFQTSFSTCLYNGFDLVNLYDCALYVGARSRNSQEQGL